VNRLGHRPALDGLRGVAILLVILGHLFSTPRGGELGVDVFFVLSGFLITTLLLEEREATGRIDLRAFYRRRALRLLPALVLMLATCSVVAVGGWAAGRLSGHDLLRQLGGIALGLTYTTNVARAWFHASPAFAFRHLWSLAQEEQFYLLWPGLLLGVYAVRRSPRALAGALAAIAVAISAYEATLASVVAGGEPLHRMWFNPLAHGESLVLGCLAAVVFVYRLAPPVPAWAVAPALGVAVAVMVLLDDTVRAVWYVLPAFGIAVALLLLRALDARTWTARALSDVRLREVGRVSYGLYLWHWPVLHVVMWPIGLPLTFLVAAVSYEYVEKPFLRRRHRSGGREGALRPLPALASARAQ